MTDMDGIAPVTDDGYMQHRMRLVVADQDLPVAERRLILAMLGLDGPQAVYRTGPPSAMGSPGVGNSAGGAWKA